MSESILTVLKFFLLALIWLFFLRVLRAQWVDLRSRDAAPTVPPATRPAPQPVAAPAPVRSPAPAPAPASGRYRVRAVEGPDPPEASVAVDREITIGRAAGADIALPGDSFISSRHARLWVDAGRLWVEDLGSTNGTQVNGQLISSATGLTPGDRVQVGRTVLEVSAA
ncbi:MAG TPA: FHA domain-containing protein [Acidimicrobiales bacterium]|nr:FHA domain-containing protein [Acidimicrobiales bacterium]